MADFPSTTSAYGVWSLKQQRRALLGSAWPTVAPTDPDFADVSLLLHGDGTDGSTTFTDSSSNNFTVTANGNAQIDTSVVKYGTGSMQFDGSGDYLGAGSNAEYAFGSGDFTIEMWVYRNGSQSTFAGLASTGSSFGSTNYQFGFGDSNNIRFLIGGSTDFNIGSSTINDAQWYHIAVTRSGSTVRFFLDGVLTDSGTNSNTLSDSLLKIGVNRGGSIYFSGYIDDFRITKGVARYTANFTPPTAAFPDQ